MPEITSTPETKAAHITDDQYRWRTYQFEVQGVEPWAVVPLVKRVRELVAHHTQGDLEYEWDTEVEVQIKFKSRETTEEPKYGYPWGNQMDDDLMLGFGWRCLRTTFADGSTIDEEEVAAQRTAQRVHAFHAGREKANQYVVVTLHADTVDGLAAVRSIVDEWDRDRGALVMVKQEDRREGTAVVVTVDGNTTSGELADLASRLTKLGTPRVVNPNRS